MINKFAIFSDQTNFIAILLWELLILLFILVPVVLIVAGLFMVFRGKKKASTIRRGKALMGVGVAFMLVYAVLRIFGVI